MDVRDVAFWVRAAQRKILFDQIRSIQAVRAGMAPAETYAERINELMAQVHGMDQEESARQNWEELKIKGRG